MKKVNPVHAPNTQEACTPGSIGMFIRAARTQQGLTIEQAAALSHVSLGTFVAAENRTSSLKLATVFKILDSLGIQVRAELSRDSRQDNNDWV